MLSMRPMEDIRLEWRSEPGDNPVRLFAVEFFSIFRNQLSSNRGHPVTVNEAWPNGMPEVGQTATRSRAISAHDIELFTEISGDRNPLHYDEDVARKTRFGGIVVQGGVTSAILNAVVAEDLPGPGTVFLQVNWNFRAPVRPGDVISGRVEITGVREDKPITQLKTQVVLEDGTVVLDGEAVCYTMPV